MGRRLVAYVVSLDGPAPAVQDLRSFLKTILPEYMVPSAFVVLDELPLSSNGKVDRRRLPAPGACPDRSRASHRRQHTRRSKAGRIFADLLGRDQVGVNDDFFELGGHSLLAMQAVSRVRQALGVELPLTSLFEKPTVAGLAESIAALDVERRERTTGAHASRPRVPGDVPTVVIAAFGLGTLPAISRQDDAQYEPGLSSPRARYRWKPCVRHSRPWSSGMRRCAPVSSRLTDLPFRLSALRVDWNSRSLT